MVGTNSVKRYLPRNILLVDGCSANTRATPLITLEEGEVRYLEVTAFNNEGLSRNLVTLTIDPFLNNSNYSAIYTMDMTNFTGKAS